MRFENHHKYHHIQYRLNKKTFSSWWLNQPISKICSSNWIISPRFGVNIKKCSKPPSFSLEVFETLRGISNKKFPLNKNDIPSIWLMDPGRRAKEEPELLELNWNERRRNWPRNLEPDLAIHSRLGGWAPRTDVSGDRITPIYKLGHYNWTNPILRGQKLTMVIDHLLNGMILQVRIRLDSS